MEVKKEPLDIDYNAYALTECAATIKTEDSGENVLCSTAFSTIKLECKYDLDPISKLLSDGTESQSGEYLTNIGSLLKQEPKSLTLKTEVNTDYTFNLPDYSKHNKKLSSRKAKFTCLICIKNFSSQALKKQHVDVHFGKCFTVCSVCGVMCGKTSEFLTHYFIHSIKRKLTNKLNLIKPHKKLMKNVLKYLKFQSKTSRCRKFYKKLDFKCKHCSDVFSCRVLFRKHKCFSNRVKHIFKKPIKCNICYKKCSTKFSLSNHLRTHNLNTIICNICSKQFLRNNYYKHYRTHMGQDLFKHESMHLPKNSFQCNVCFKEFADKTQLETHMYDHIGVKPFMCEFCSKEFARTDSLRNHLKMHMDDKKFQCDVCQRRFVRRITLVEHYRTHTGEKPFKCELCPKKFTQKSQLRSHNRTHITEKPFECEICSKQFVIQFQLKRHMLTHNTKKRFECETCFKQFIEKRNLNAHMLLHTGTKPFKCELCSKSFTWRHNLNRHMKIHEENAFQCDICQEKFSRYHILQNHYRLHTGEVPYKCDICPKQFKQKVTLTAHMLNHTTEDF